MKNYEERLPMIDEAVIKNNGKFPPTAIGYSRRGYYAKGDNADILYKINHGDVCTRSEFESRARELGWINGYQYGVEYETNGEKPDLPDDVLVAVKNKHTGKWEEFNDLKVDDIFWSNISVFRITDELYKPKETVSESNWHERGELPPVGSFVEYHVNGSRWDKCEVLATDEDALWLKRSNGRLVTRLKYIRPIQSERDKLVDKASKIPNTTTDSGGLHRAAHALIDAGWRPTGDK